MYIKQLRIPLVLNKCVTIPDNMNTQIKLQPKYPAVSFQVKFDFQGKTIISGYPADKYHAFYPLIVQCEANRCKGSIKNTEGSMVINSVTLGLKAHHSRYTGGFYKST